MKAAASRLWSSPWARSLLSPLAGIGVINALQLVSVFFAALVIYLATEGPGPELDMAMTLVSCPIAFAGGWAAASVAGRMDALHAGVLALLVLFFRFMIFGAEIGGVEYLDVPFIALGGALRPWALAKLAARRKARDAQ